ncbi:phosphate regulon sensor protein PhoR [Psychromonas sp. CNPT3]|uniref:phosphate regulon sensor histidine kinase PhoR n=1 Tax=Psychromonas sp. CNPT3 TaxID=314282 RepID=UPI0002C05931|nr:phosphate regulon sensor histidine kinase PhoR [Psychromonas sp. CNPT3]AGH79995.1 phosphate regulon sensor protein PhoR [Psychromonas sp. CNPT3]
MYSTVPFYRGVWKSLYLYSILIMIGFFCDEILLSILIANFIQIFWFYRYQFKLFKWLWRDKKRTPPIGTGSWEMIFNGLFRLQNRHYAKRAALTLTIKKFRAGADAVPDALIFLDSNYAIIWSNQLAQQLLGLKLPRDIGQQISNLIRIPVFIKELKSNLAVKCIEITSPINNNIRLEIRFIRYLDKQQILIVRDITQVHQLEEVKRNFVANLSHELRTPLTVLKGYLEIFDVDDLPVEYKRALKAMSEQSLRMEALIDDLLLLSRIENGAMVDLNQEVNIALIISQIEQECKMIAVDKKLNLIFNVDSTLISYGNASYLRSAMSNLVFNAINYSPAGGNIKITWNGSTQGGLFSVKDDGFGISTKDLVNITQRFYRAEIEGVTSKGSGLGLSIVKHALKNHDSELLIKSKLHKGSTFSFILPKVTIKRD